MKRIHLICNAHIDPIWQWSWDEGISTVIATFKSAADLADEFDYVFCHGESLLYEAIENYAPELFERIRSLVKEGKWKITGGWYLQPDCLMPSGESIIRQIEVGQAYFMEKFGVKPTVATNYDSFGHSIGLVQIMAKYGYKAYLHDRPYRCTKQFEYPEGKFYKWIAPDGSCVICADTFSYSSPLGKATEKILKEVDEAEDVDYIMWGVGNHGGGPSRKDLKDIENLQIDGVKFIHSYPEAVFDDNIRISGEVKRSLTPSMPGCYSSMAKIKQAHRETENLLYATEKMLTIANLCGMQFDNKDFINAQKQLLLAEFHDILPGSCVRAGEIEGLELLDAAKKTANDYRTKAFLYLTINEKVAKEGEYPIFVFNYLPYEITAPIEAEFNLADQNVDENFIFVPQVYCDDKNIPCQQIKEESTINLDWRKKIIFEGKLKPLSITRFSVYVKKTEIKDVKREEIKDFNDFATLEMYDDTADPWAMSKEELHCVGTNPREFRLMNGEEIREFCAIDKDLPAIHQIENGEVYSAFEKFVVLDSTKGVIEYKQYKNQPYCDLKVTVEFAEKNKLIRLKIPTPRGNAIGDGPFIVEPKTDGEINFQKWVGVQREDGNIFAVINDGIYAGKVEDGYVYLTLLRGVGYCFHPVGRELYPQDRYLPRIDCGRYVFNVRIYTGSLYEVCKNAELFNQKPYAINLFPIGDKSKKFEFVISDNVIMSSLQFVDGGYNLRLFNPTDEDKKVEIQIEGKSYDTTVKKYKFENYYFNQDNIFTNK